MTNAWQFFLDYNAQMFLGLVVLYNVVTIYFDHFATNRNTVSGEELLYRYGKLIERRKKV